MFLIEFMGDDVAVLEEDEARGESSHHPATDEVQNSPQELPGHNLSYYKDYRSEV